jgi:menaquinone-dependent protoporphyrinogen oxidase
MTYASKYGATQGIAERIAQKLRQLSRAVELQPVSADVSPESYEAVVIGSAVYYGSWLKEAVDYVRRQRFSMAARQVWLFSDGPLGSEANEQASRPKEIAEFQEYIHLGGIASLLARLTAASSRSRNGW